MTFFGGNTPPGTGGKISNLAETLYNIAVLESVDPTPAHIQEVQKVFENYPEDTIRANLARVLAPFAPSDTALDKMSKVAHLICIGAEIANPVIAFRELRLHLSSLFEGKSDEEIIKFFQNADSEDLPQTCIALMLRTGVSSDAMGDLLSKHTQ